jgi:hypothetical protein
VISGSEFLVAGLNDHRIFEALADHVGEDQIVLDLANIPRREASLLRFLGHNDWKPEDPNQENWQAWRAGIG